MKLKTPTGCTQISDSSKMVISSGFYEVMRVFFLLNASYKETVVSVFVLLAKTEGKESPWQRMGSELAESDQGSIYRQEKWLRR